MSHAHGSRDRDDRDRGGRRDGDRGEKRSIRDRDDDGGNKKRRGGGGRGGKGGGGGGGKGGGKDRDRDDGRDRRDNKGSNEQQANNLYVTGLPADIDEQKLRGIFSEHGKVSQCKVLPPRPGEQKTVALIRFDRADDARRTKDALNNTTLPGTSNPVQVRFAENKNAKGGDGDRGDRGGDRGDRGGDRGDRGGDRGDRGGDRGDRGGDRGDRGGNSGPVRVQGSGVDGIVSTFEAIGPLKATRGHEHHKGQLYVAGLPPDTGNVHLYRLFAPFGAIGPKGVHAMMTNEGKCKGIAFVNFLEEESAQLAIATYNGAVLPDGTAMKVSMKMPKGSS